MPASKGPISNAELSKLLGVTHTQISRMRCGSRHPSTMTMSRIEDLIGWSRHDQMDLVIADKDELGTIRGKYAAGLDAALQAWRPGKQPIRAETESPQPPVASRQPHTDDGDVFHVDFSSREGW